MKTNLKLKMALGMLALGVAGAAAADPRGRGAGMDYARVVDVTPIVQRVRLETPAQQCWQETEYRTIRHEAPTYYERDKAPSAVPAVAGGIIGGVIGRQFGSGSGKDAMTVLGALVGASVGSQSAQSRVRTAAAGSVSYEQRPVTVERCETTISYREEERIEGYRVTYVYADREYVTTMASHPGSSIPVRVTVVPAAGRR